MMNSVSLAYRAFSNKIKYDEVATATSAKPTLTQNLMDLFSTSSDSLAISAQIAQKPPKWIADSQSSEMLAKTLQ